MADQRWSQTMRTESSACGDGHRSTKTSCSGISEEKAPEQEADKKTAQSQKDEDNVQRSTLTLRKDLKLVKAGKPVPADGEGDGDEHAQGTETCTEPSPATANREGNHDLRGKRRTRRSKTKRRKSAPEYAPNRTRSAAAVWIMMALTVATSSLAGAECIGTEVKLDKGEAVLRCPLPVNASAPHQGIIVKDLSTSDSAGAVMFCCWPTEEADKPEWESSDGFSQVGQLTDQAMAKVPVSRLMDSGAYKSHGMPYHDHQYFTPCRFHRFSDSGAGQSHHANVAGVMAGVVGAVLFGTLVL